jgi:hypothetical protein
LARDETTPKRLSWAVEAGGSTDSEFSKLMVEVFSAFPANFRFELRRCFEHLNVILVQ